MKSFALYILISLILVQANCNRNLNMVVLNDCDTFGNYFVYGVQYFGRDLVTDDGVIDYNKMLDSYKGRKTVCNPLNNP